MLGILINEKEKEELLYLLKRELDDMQLDLQEERIDYIVKRTLMEKYDILFLLLKRVGTREDYQTYVRVKENF